MIFFQKFKIILINKYLTKKVFLGQKRVVLVILKMIFGMHKLIMKRYNLFLKKKLSKMFYNNI